MDRPAAGLPPRPRALVADGNRPTGLVLAAVVVATGVALGALALGLGSLAVTQRGLALFALLVLDLACATWAVPRGSLVGFVVGTYLLGVHVVGWTVAHRGPVLAGMSAAYVCVLFLAWVLAGARVLPAQLKGWFPLWVGVLPWAPSVLSAALAGEWQTATGRVLAASGAMLWVLLTRATDPERLVLGVLGGVHSILAAVLVCAIGQDLPDFRFQGGPCAQVHPNILGMIASMTGLAWLTLRPAPRFARAAGATLGAGLLILTDARTAAGAGLIGAGVALAGSWGHPTRWPARMARLAVVGGALTAGVWGLALPYFLRERGPGVGVLSGRERIWAVATSEFLDAPLQDKLLGTASGGVGAAIQLIGQSPPLGSGFTPHNAVVDLVRRTGLVGACLGTAGLAMALGELLRSLGRRDRRAGSSILAAAMATIPVESWFFGGSLFTWTALGATFLRPAPPRERSRAGRRDVRA